MNRGFFASVLACSTDFRFYKEIVGQAIGKTIKYFLFLALLITVLLGVRYGIGANEFIKKGFSWIEENTPRMEINEGIVTADAKQPFKMEQQGFVLMIDTTGQTTEIESKYKTGILVGKDYIKIKADETRTKTITLNKIKKFVLDKAMFEKIRTMFVYVFLPFLLVTQFIFFIISKLIQAVLAGLLVASARPEIKFANAFNICVYALTPISFLTLIVSYAFVGQMPFFWIISLGMYVAFVIGAVGQVSKQAEQK